MSEENLYLSETNLYLSEENIYLSEENIYLIEENLYLSEENLCHFQQYFSYIIGDQLYWWRKPDRYDNVTPSPLVLQ